MLDAVFATKLGMTQAWSKSGKRLAVTKCKVDDNIIVGSQTPSVTDKSTRRWKRNHQTVLEVGYGTKKIANMSKPLSEKIKKSGFTFGVKQIKGIRHNIDETNEESPLKIGDSIALEQVLEVGDVVKVQGVSKGRGFAGVIKRHNFHGGPRTHGQSDRERAPGSIGAGTSPGHVWKGKKMPGHYGAENKTVLNLVVLHIDSENKEVWLSGPVPGANASIVRISKTGTKKNVELDLEAMGLKVEEPVKAEEPKVEVKTEDKVSEDKKVEKPEVEKEKTKPKKEDPKK